MSGYFVTGATGFIGRHLVERLLARGGRIFALTRAESLPRLERLIERYAAHRRIEPVVGDLAAPRLGVSDAALAELAGGVDHFFHLAALYDLTAGEEANERANVDGTRHAVELASAIPAGRFHHASSVAVAGRYQGMFREDMLDEGQSLEHPYDRTKLASEVIARSEPTVPWRVYRPAIVVGHSRTGEIDKADGPYHFLPLVRLLRRFWPRAVPVPSPRFGDTNVVPVDYVAAAIDHIAHQPGLDGGVFQLVNPEPQRSLAVINAFAGVAGAPRFAGVLPRGSIRIGARVGLRRIGIPAEILDHVDFTARFDSTEARRALAGSGIEVPPLSSYVGALWGYWSSQLRSDATSEDSGAVAMSGQG